MNLKVIKDRIKEIEGLIPARQAIYGYRLASKEQLLYDEYILLKKLEDLYSSSWYRVIVGLDGK